MYKRTILLDIKKTKKSILLLGPRQTGKSTLIKSLDTDLQINFAYQKVFLDHSQNFNLLPQLIERKKAKTIFIDEVQRLPEVLNTVQALIDDQHLKFYLTGSSARKLKRGGANLLPGRVLNYSLGPLTLKELNYNLSKENLIYGFLPGIETENDINIKKEILTSYEANYLHEEIKAEALVKNLPAFSRFLEVIPQHVGEFLDQTKIAKKAQLSRQLLPRYFEILEDTLIAYRIFPDINLKEKYDLVKHPKIFFFDVGIYNALLKNFSISNDRAGKVAEQVVFQQIFHSAQSLKKEIKIHSLRTRGGAEIDFWILLNNTQLAIEVKNSDKITDGDVRTLVHFKKLEPNAKFYVFHLGEHELKVNGIWCLPLAKGLQELGL